MKTQKTLTELATEIDRQKDAKRDFVADTRHLGAISTENDVELLVGGEGTGNSERFPIADTAHRQIGARLEIPAKYYDRMRRESPKLLATNINHWLANEPQRRMVRTLDGNVRAFLSDRYQRIENEEVASVVLPILQEFPDVQIASCALTPTKMYIKAVLPKIQSEIGVGDYVQSGVVISNSEVGMGAVTVEPLVYRLVCLNGMVVNDAKLRANHVGGHAKKTDAVYEMLSDEALEADDKAILLKIRDVVRATAYQGYFDQTVDRIRLAASDKIQSDPIKAVEVLQNKLSLNETEKGGVLRHLIEGGDLSKWGVVNALTRQSQDVEDYDRATDFERFGGQVLDLPQQNWREIAHAGDKLAA